MTPTVRGALLEWASGAIVGLIPLLAHWLVATFADSSATNGDWAIDILFIAITTSGLSVVTVFTRMIKKNVSLDGSIHLIIMVTITILIVAASAILYGVVASGHGHNPLGISLIVLLSSLAVSMYFELAMARRLPPPVAGAPA